MFPGCHDSAVVAFLIVRNNMTFYFGTWCCVLAAPSVLRLGEENVEGGSIKVVY